MTGANLINRQKVPKTLVFGLFLSSPLRRIIDSLRKSTFFSKTAFSAVFYYNLVVGGGTVNLHYL